MVLVVVIALLFKIVINPDVVVISNPFTVAPLPSVTVLYVKPLILVISLLLPSFTVSNNSGYVALSVYIKSLSDIFRYRL